MLFVLRYFLLTNFMLFPSHSESVYNSSQEFLTQNSKNHPQKIYFNSSPFLPSTKLLYESQKLNELYGFESNFSHPNIQKSVFRITRLNWTGAGIYGTVFYIGNNRFVTNFHVAYPSLIPRSLSLEYKGESFSFSKILSLDYENDLMVLKLNEKDFNKIKSELIPLELSSASNFPTDSKGVIYGFSLLFNKEAFFEIGFESYKMERGEKDLTIFANRELLNGMSGGPVLIGDEVIGVMKSASYNKVKSAPSEFLISLLEETSNGGKNHLIHSWRESLKSKKKALQNDTEHIHLQLSRSFVLGTLFSLWFVKSFRHYAKKGDFEGLKSMLSDEFLLRFPGLKLFLAHYLYENGQEDEALKIYMDLAREGLSSALYHLAVIAVKEKREWEMVKLMELAGLKGDGFASYIMGLYKSTSPLEENISVYPFSAEEWFKESIQQGYLPALFKLISIYKEEGHLEEAKKLKKALNKYRFGGALKVRKARKRYEKLQKSSLEEAVAESRPHQKSYSPKKTSCLQIFTL